MQDRLILNRYRPISQAGAGGFGTVTLAWDTRIQRRVAIKAMQLDPDLIPPNIPDSFDGPDAGFEPAGGTAYDAASVPGLEEARTAAMLTDPNIVGVLDFEVQDDTAYLIMEYVDGMTLTQLLRECGDDVSVDIVGAVFQGIAHALNVAHENQVLHLDIKPDNVLINHQGNVKVTDFGLSKLSGVTGFTQAGGGTIGYMPPEQMRLQPLDVRCDEWALASLVYEMISGENPFLANSIPQAEAIIEDAELVLPSLCLDGLDSQVDDVIFYALDPDREERYATVKDFAEELQPFLGNAAAGRKQLAKIVGNACSDEETEEDASAEHPAGASRVRHPSAQVIMRVWAAVECGALGFVSAANIVWIPGTGSPVFWGALALIVLAAALMPPLGAVLALVALAVAFASHGSYVVCGLLCVAGVLWWFGIGRRGAAQPDTALSSALFGSFGCGRAAPLLCGVLLPAGEAVANAAFAWFIGLVFASLGSMSIAGWWAGMYWNHVSAACDQALILLLQQPATWVALAAWMLSALITSVLCGRGRRGLALLGAVLGGAVLGGGITLEAWLASGMTGFTPDYTTVALTVVPVVVVVVLILAGAMPAERLSCPEEARN